VYWITGVVALEYSGKMVFFHDSVLDNCCCFMREYWIIGVLA
jgi:hypothetical protein